MGSDTGSSNDNGRLVRPKKNAYGQSKRWQWDTDTTVFNFTAAMKNNFAAGKTVHAYGEIKRGNYGLEIVHPDYKFRF